MGAYTAISSKFALTMRLPIADIIHRGVVTSLFGLTLFGLAAGVSIHRERLQKGRGK
jgi:hypothetical protein